MIDESKIAQRLKELRQKKGKTLEDIAEQTGLSKGYLSRVENSPKAPPVSTLTKISNALKVSISTIFGEEESYVHYHITKKEKRPVIVRKGSKYGYSYESLAIGYANRKMDPYFVEIPNNINQPMYQHKGEEFFFIVRGAIRVIFDEIEFVLNEGDCCYFDASKEHCAHSIGDSPAMALMVIYSDDE